MWSPAHQQIVTARLTPPVGGTFHFENLIMPPLIKTCPKMVLSHKGGSLCVKDVFAKKFFGAGRDSLAALAFRYRLDSEHLPHFLWPQRLALSTRP